MKHVKDSINVKKFYHNVLLKSIFIGIISLIFLFPLTILAAENTQQQIQSPRERAMKAAEQLRHFKNKYKMNQKGRDYQSSFQSKSDVSIRFNNSIRSASVIYFYDNMESGTNGWTTIAYTGSDLWHQTTSDASSKPTSWWVGIESQQNYDNGSRINNALISPTINLIGAVPPVKLMFTENFVTETGWDYCMVDVSTDGGTSWNHLRGGYGSAPSGDTDGWMITDLDLSAYANNQILLRFYFDTGDQLYNEFLGWYVDDVIIFDKAGLITGKTFFDVNNNGTKDIGERGIKEWLVTAQGNDNPISLTTRTNYRGRYWLPLPLGSYTLTEEQKVGWTQTYPPGNSWTIDLATPDTLVDSIHFGNWTQASFINGIKFHDLSEVKGTYDGGDTLLPEWKILLTDTLGNEIDFDRTDSIGEYQLYVFTPGKYLVKEVEKHGWIQTYPQSEYYTIDIPDLQTVVNGKDFGNYWSPTTNGIMGQKFADRNRNHIRDQGEENLAGFKIQLFRKGNGNKYNLHKQRTTDSSGYYQFLSLEPDTYKVVEQPLEGWWQSYPDSCYYVDLTQSGTFDTLDFGNYEIDYSSISGMKFNDINGNGIKDEGDNGLSDWTIMLSGVDSYGKTVTKSTDTDVDGIYTFQNLWPGNYTISEVFRSFWRQTYPENLAPNFVNLPPESEITGINFGNTQDSTFSLAFRTFLPESLALAVDLKGKTKPIPLKPNKLEYWITLYNDTTMPSHSLIVHTTGPMDDETLTCSKPGTITFLDGKAKKIQIIFEEYVQPGDSVTLHGFTKKMGIQHASYQKWMLAGGGIYIGHHENFVNIPRLPMPNAINLLSSGAGTGLRVGLGGPHSVVHNTYNDVLKSLIDKHGMHIGDPRCLGTFSGVKPKPIKKQQKYLPPSKHNNKLFAEAIALQANINGSDYGILPGGFGNLIFDEGGENICNGLKIREIANKLDSAMSLFNDTTLICTYNWQPESFFDIFNTIRKIDSAFSGPIDTFSFASGLRFKPVRQLSEVPFLHLDSSFIEMGSFTFKPIPETKPEKFVLEQNYPNPFNPSTVIEFYLPYQSFVTLKVYNSIGQEVATLLDHQEMEDGSQEIELKADEFNLASGIYYYRLIAETITDEDNPTGQKFVSVRKMILLK